MNRKIYKIMLLIAFAVNASVCVMAQDVAISIPQIAFEDPIEEYLGSEGGTVSVAVIYSSNDIPNNPDEYIEHINSAISKDYDDCVQVYQINPTSIVFTVTENTSEDERTITIQGNTSKTLTIIQDGAAIPDSGDDTATEPKFNISGNWIIKRTYTNDTESTWYDDITFYNGLGYPDQIIQVRASSVGKNMVTPIVYDAHMREDATSYLPYASNNTIHVKESSPLTTQQTYYTGKYGSADGARAYAQKIYEASSLGRVAGERKSGSAYDSKQVSYNYSTNTANEVFQLRVTYGTEGALSTATLSVSYYSAASLYKTTVTNEDGGQRIEYKDFKGNVVLERRLISGTTYADTYYCYDYKGQPVWIVTPQGSVSLSNGASYSASHVLAVQYSYLYAYDGNGNIIEKRQPGREPEYYVYDKGKREVMYQDGNMRQNNQWIYTTYDNHNRIAEKTVVTTTLTRTSLQGLYSASSFNNKYENLTNPNIPANAQDVSVVKILYSGRYYGYTYSSSANPAAFLPFVATDIAPQSELSTLTHGELKYEKHLLLTSGEAQQYKETAYYYNNLAQLLQSVTKYPNGNILRTSFKYDFMGNIIAQEEKYGTITKLTTCTYDNRGKLLSENIKINGTTAATVTYAYDDMGRVAKRTLGNGVTEVQGYNIQGWATALSATKGTTNIYSQNLGYYTTAKSTTPLYSGNISEWGTQQGTNAQNTYGFTYDLQGRLLSSSLYKGTSTLAQNAYTERGISYDNNGNILKMQRYGANLQDNYTYTYSGNKLSSISGHNNGTAIASANFSYDNNGNTITDGLKNLQISYNILNLQEAVTQGGTILATYGWFADGSKWSVENTQGNGYRYIGSLIYNTGSGGEIIESAEFSQGRIIFSSSTAHTTHYHHRDHLGSVRAITDGAGTTIEQNAYYPFGGRHSYGQTYLQTTANRHKFNGKEEQTIGNLGLLDYGARMYDPAIGRWTAQDPLGEEMYNLTPYRFSLNNPISVIDFMGLSDYFNFNGQYLGSDGSTDDLIRIISDDNWENVQTIDKDGNVNVNIEAALKLSSFFSDASMNKDAILNVYNHYNLTGLELKERDDYNNEDIKAGMTFSIQYNKKTNKYTPCIKIPIELNRDSDIYNHYWNIVNSFEHEKQHYRDFKVWGIEKYKSHSKSEKEKRAISYQYNHYSYQYTTVEFQRGIKAYWKSKK